MIEELLCRGTVYSDARRSARSLLREHRQTRQNPMCDGQAMTVDGGLTVVRTFSRQRSQRPQSAYALDRRPRDELLKPS